MPFRKLARLLRLGFQLAPLGAGPFERAKLVLLVVGAPLKRIIPLTRGRWVPMRLRLAQGGRTFSCVVSEGAELETLKDVFVDDDYALPDGLAPQVVVDLGSHVGFSILFFALRYPEATIYGFEPDPRTFAKLAANVAGLPNVRIEQAAVAAHDGEVELYSADRSWASSLVAAAGGRPTRVRAKRLDTILAEHSLSQVDVLKIDVEGAELEVLRGFDGLERVGWIIGEVHLDLAEGTLDELRSLLPGFEVELEPDVPQRYRLRALRR